MAQSLAERVRKIREMYELGCALPKESAYGKEQAVKLATKRKVGHGTVYRAKQFASLFKKKEDVDRLCKLCRNGNSLGWGHVTKILKVKSEEKRWDLLDLAAQNNWSARELEREVDRRYPRNASTAAASRRPLLMLRGSCSK
ncbi:MAG: hypothetical protein H6822_06585 [Planctomycetaceae bacterium]|nr:hypothetical protein [Planctomycetales bacterium]MCB9921828.1 hypothetical protein [Planctomycetaceae bacterium]